MEDNVEKHMNVCKELNKIYEAKNNDYNDSFHKSFTEYGLLMLCIRLEDKLNRIKSFANNKNMKVKDESIIDTLLDMANYSILGVMELHAENLKKN